jgi:hypothetical protein
VNLQRLSFNAMPPLDVPFRFFVTAPIFGIIVSLLFLFASPYELSSRWSNLMIAATHGLTLGFMLMVMIGALFQVLPVVLGVSMPKTKILSCFIYYCLLIGIFSLIFGLYLVNHFLLTVAIISLSSALSSFLIGFLYAALGMPETSSSLSIRLACLSLLITLCLGLYFVLGWLNPNLFSSFRMFTNIHLLWGFIGWTFLLVMGVSFQIIPMFYVTPDYPKWLSKFLPATIFFQLVLISLFQPVAHIKTFSFILLALTTSIYPAYTLYLISLRRRKSQDITLRFWNTSMSAYLLSAVIFLVSLFYNGHYLAEVELLFACMLLLGFAITLMTGMLLKIIPFLVWLNLQQTWIKYPSKKMPLSNMQQVIPSKIVKHQYSICMAMMFAIFTLCAGIKADWFIQITAILVFINFSHLLIYLIKSKQTYNRALLELASQQL